MNHPLGVLVYIYIYIPRTHLTSVLIGKDNLLGGLWSKIEVIQVLGIYIYIYGSWVMSPGLRKSGVAFSVRDGTTPARPGGPACH